MKKLIPFLLVISLFLSKVSWGQTNPGFETGDLTGWTDAASGTEANSTFNARTGSRSLSYSTGNASNQRIENTFTFTVTNNSYFHTIAWAIGSNADAKAGVTIWNGSTWDGATSQVIGTTLTRLIHVRRNTTGSESNSFRVGLNSAKVTNSTILYWDDVVAYVSTSATTDLTPPNSPTLVNTVSNAEGTSISITWTDGTDASAGSQEALILRASGINQTPPSLNDQGRYSVLGGSNGPNIIGTWSVLGVVGVGTQTFIDNTVSANTEYTYAVYMRDLAYNYSSGTSSSISALPVELTSFTALIADNGVHLNWETATEVNNYGFNVERRVKNEEWSKIGFVNGNGNSNSPKSYTFTDNAVPAGKIQYRLKQIDFDGKFEYSEVVEVNVEAPNKLVLYQNSPNPFNPSTVISYKVQAASHVTLKVYDVLGRKVATLVDEYKNAGNYKTTFNVETRHGMSPQSGVYFYRLTAGSFVQTKKMMLLK